MRRIFQSLEQRGAKQASRRGGGCGWVFRHPPPLLQAMAALAPELLSTELRVLRYRNRRGRGAAKVELDSRHRREVILKV